MKKIIFTLLITLISFNIYSQNIGIKGGFVLSKVSGLDHLIRPTVGIFLQTKGNVYFISEVNFKNIGGDLVLDKTNAQNVKTGETRVPYRNYYIEFPLMVGVKSDKSNINPFINAGVAPAVLVDSKYNGSKNKSANGFNIGLVVSPGVMFGKNVSLEARLCKSIIGINGSSYSDLISASLLLGIKF